jgi:hypothetical protein
MTSHRPLLLRWYHRAAAVALLWLNLLLLPPILYAQPRPEDPLPIQRLELPVERIPAEMENVRRNMLRLMPRSDFEDLVQMAAQAREAERDPPRLVEAKYRAVLQEDGLSGSAEWKIVQRATGPGRLSLQTLQLALGKARWPDNRPARLGFLEDRPNAPLELWIDKPGEHSLTLEWSARGIPQPGGWRFDLRVPACPVLALELDLPAGDALLADGDGIRISGPLHAATPNRSLWHVTFTGATASAQVQLPFLVLRSPQMGQPGPLVRYGIYAVQKILAGEVECDFDIDLNVSRGGIRELIVMLDPGLRPRDVVVPNLESWDTQPGPAGTTQLLVRMREPLVGGKATVRTLSALPGPGVPWASPSVRVDGGIPRGESLQLRIHPAWQLQDWKSGRFRLANVQTAADQFQVLTLQESGLSAEIPARPEAKLGSVDAVFDLRQSMDWRIDPDAMYLTVQLSCEVRRGLVFELPVVIPSAWELDQIESPRFDAGLRSRVQPKSGAGQSSLHVEFRQPLSARADKTGGESKVFNLGLRFRARPPRLPMGNEGTAESIPFPQVQVLGARQRDERLAIRLNTALFGSALTDAAIDPWVGGDWPGGANATRPDYYYAAQGRSLEGTLQVRFRRSRVQARCNSEATILGTHWRLIHRLELIPRSGSLQETLISFSAPLPADSRIQVANQPAEVLVWEPFPIDAFRRCLSVVGSTSIWTMLTAAQTPQTGQTDWWRLVLSRPVQEPMTLELSCSHPIENEVALPLLLAPNADTFEGQLLVQTSPAQRWDYHSMGLQELQVDSHSPDTFSADWPRREFQYRSTAAALSLRPAGPSQPEMARCEYATLFLQPRSDQHMLAVFSFTAAAWRDASLPVTLPAGARLIAARLNGQDVFIPPGQNATVALPWMPFLVRNHGEIVYELPWNRVHLVSRWNATAPALPFPAEMHRYWDLPEDLVPVNGSADWQQVPANAATFPIPLVAPRNVWESRPGRDRSSLTVIRPLFVRAAGLLVGVLAAAITAVGLGLHLRWKSAVLISILVLSCWAWIWLPNSLEELAVWPFVVIGLTVLFRAIAYLPRRRGHTRASESDFPMRSSVVVSSLILLVLAFTGNSAPPVPTPVYLLSGPPGRPEAGSVLAPPELIEQLQGLRRRLTPRGAMLLEARYDGRIGDDAANFEAHYQVHCWNDEKAVIQLPLSGIQLRQALLDGADAWPRSSGPERLLFDVSGAGSHLLTLRFSVPINGTSEREARFGIPELPISKLTVSAPRGVTRLQTLSWKGAQQLQMQPEPKLEADLGRIQTVHLIWQVPGDSAHLPPVPVQEVHLWDLSEATGRLQSVFRYSLGSQSLSSFTIDVPPELEVAQASVRAIDSRIVSPGQPGLKSWRWEGQGPKRRLHLELPFPLTGQIQLHLELLGRQPMGRNPALAVPVAAGSVERQTFLAYRLQGIQANLMESRGWEKVSEDSFWLKIWLPLRAEPRSARPAQAFARERDSQGVVRLNLLTPALKGHGEQRVAWSVGPGRAELSAVGRWVDVPVPGLLQWEVPVGIHLDEVRAPNLRSWSRTGSRLQIWLDSADQMPAEPGIVVQLTGWMPRPAVEAEQEKTPFVVPNMWLHGLAEQTTQVHVATRDGWRLLPTEVREFSAAPDIDLPGYRWSGYPASADARAAFRLLPASGTGAANILTVVEANSRQLQLQSWLDLSVPAGEKLSAPSSLTLEMRRGFGWNPQLELPAGCRLRETRTNPGVTAWTLDLLPGRHLVRVVGRRTLNATEDISVPAISVRSLHAPPAVIRSWVAVSGRELELLAFTGLAPSSKSDLPDSLPGRDKSTLQIWRVAQDDWRLRVQPLARVLAKPQVLAEFQAAVGPNGAWLQEARYWLFQQAEAEWAVTLPAGAKSLSAWFDGQEVSALDSPGPVTAKPGLHFLRLVWRTGSSIGEAEPRIEMPRLQYGGQTVSEAPISTTIRLPSGYNLIAHLGTPRISPTAKFTRQAAAELAFLRLIAAQVPADSLQPLQRDLDRNLASAEEHFGRTPAGLAVETGPGGQPLTNWLRQLREQNPAQPSAAQNKQNALPYAAAFDQGEAYCWQGMPEGTGEIRVIPHTSGLLWRWLATAALGLLLLLGLWFPRSSLR